MTDEDVDLHGYGPRLKKLAVAVVIGAVVTFAGVTAMKSSGPAPNADAVGSVSVWMVAIAMFLATTVVAHKIISRKRR